MNLSPMPLPNRQPRKMLLKKNLPQKNPKKLRHLNLLPFLKKPNLKAENHPYTLFILIVEKSYNSEL